MKKSNVIVIAVVVLVAVLALLSVSLTALAEPASGVEHVDKAKVVHLSDIHIMIDEYCNIYSPAYQKAGNTSYKVLEQTKATAMACFDEMYLNKDGSLKAAADIPLYVVITGDLTSNGELANHVGVAEMLGEVTDTFRALATRPGYEALAGFQIFVIPGNHDIDNQNAKCYTPALDDAQWNALVQEGDAAKMRNYLSSYEARSVETTTMLQFMSIYSDFGYCNCAGRKEGHHEGGCKVAEGVKLEYFYESDYWYESGVTRSARPVDLGADSVALTPTKTYSTQYAVYTNGVAGNALTEIAPTEEEIAAYKVDKDMEYYARASRHGACSYVARVDGITILGIDANSHKWTDVKEGAKLSVTTSLGWEETTGGYMTEALLNWIINSVKADVAANRLVMALAHENVLPHFDAEDEVISLFTYDNWEDVYTNMADNGIRYVFTGHQHTNDIESEVSQMGSVFYDVETGSTTCMGAGWREVDFEQTFYTDGAYAEDAYSTMHYLHYNTQVDGVDAFGYQRYEVKPDGSYGLVTVYQGKNGLDNKDGEYQDLADFMSLNLKSMISNMAGNVVNEHLMDTLHGMVSGLSGDLGAVADKVITDLGNLNLYRFTVAADGSNFTMSAEPDPTYHLTQFAIDFVDYFLHKDYSFDKKLGVYLDDVLLYAYGNHLIGGQCHSEDEIPAGVVALLENLENGTFLRFVEDLLYRGLLPQIELILRAPIYWGDSINYKGKDTTSKVTADMVAGGKGFDLGEKGSALWNSDNIVVSMIKGFVEETDTNDGMDISSLLAFVSSLPELINTKFADSVNQDTGKIESSVVYRAVKTFLDGKGIDLDKYWKYVDLATGYIEKLDGHTLCEVIKDELLDKYVTDAFCKNLGSYGAYVVRTVLVDDSLDGVERTSATGLFPYEVQARFHLIITCKGEKGEFANHTYYRAANGSDKVTVVATKENGLLPGKISVGNVITDGKLDTTKKEIRWFTQRDVDYSTPASTCKQYEWSNAGRDAATQYYCEMQLADNVGFEGATTTKYKGENVWVEYPTIDLGIMYLNITYAYRQYNDFDVVLEGLTAGKTYYYRLRAVDVDNTGAVVKTYAWTEAYSFATPKATGGVNVMAMTDIQGSIEANYTASLPNMLKAIEGNPDYIISCGDNVDKGENIAQWTWLLDDQAAVWANYAFSGVAGNHEKHSYSISSVTATPDVAVDGESGFYYSYDYQNVHFVMLNTNDIVEVQEVVEVEMRDADGKVITDADGNAYTEYAISKSKSLGKAQYAWLEADLDRAKANTDVEFIVVVLHKGPYTAGSHAFDEDVIALRAQLAPLFAAKGVDLVLQGHDHTYSVSDYIGSTADNNGKYGTVDVTYDASGAAVNPQGTLYVNLGTMGDKYYNYIYSPLVTLKDRSGDSYLSTYLADYITEAGNLELSPVRDSRTVLAETPVYAYLNVTEGRLSLVTYTVIDGKVYVVDDIAITRKAAATTAAVAVMGVKLDSGALDALDAVRVPVVNADGTTDIYVGYRLADLLAAKGKKSTTFRFSGNTYDVGDAYVMVAKANGSELTAIDTVVLICSDGSVIMASPADIKGGLEAWVIVVIVAGAVAAAALVVVLVLVLTKRKKIAGTSSAETGETAVETQEAQEAEAETETAEDDNTDKGE